MATHEVCPDCGIAPEGAFKYRDKWFVKCKNFGCHCCTGPTDSPEAAFAVWDGWARRTRLSAEYGERKREEARAAMVAAEDEF